MKFGIIITSIILCLILLFNSCQSNRQLPDPKEMKGCTKEELYDIYGEVLPGYIFTAYNDEGIRLINYGYDMGQNEILVFTLENNTITFYHTTQYRNGFPESIEGITFNSLIMKYGEPFHDGYTLDFDDRDIYRVFYKARKQWNWKQWKYLENSRYVIVTFLDQKVNHWSVYNYNNDEP